MTRNEALNEAFLQRRLRDGAEDGREAFLASLVASGFAIVPVEATDEMIRDGTCVDHPWAVPKVSLIWTAMLAAAQKDTDNA